MMFNGREYIEFNIHDSPVSPIQWWLSLAVTIQLAVIVGCGSGNNGSQSPGIENEPPVGTNDEVATPQATTIVINVLENDSDFDGDTLTIISVDEPAHGAAIQTDLGEISYTPIDSFVGMDQFSYTLSDGLADSEAFVTVLIRPVEFSTASLLATSGGDGSLGFVINGFEVDGSIGDSVSSGDSNGDGKSDVLIGAQFASPNGPASGQVYLLFGRSEFPAEIDLLSLVTGADVSGIVFNGTESNDRTGARVYGGGDYDGDSLSDLLVPAIFARSDIGRGRATLIPGSEIRSDVFELSDLLLAERVTSVAPIVVDAAGSGDFDGDGIDDLLLGDDGLFDDPGEVIVIFGRADGIQNDVDPSAIAATMGEADAAGFVLNGIGQGDDFGTSAAGLGDVNDDGIADFIVGAKSRNDAAGQSYVIFGSAAGSSADFDVRQLLEAAGGDGSMGFVLNGIEAGDDSGVSVAGAGDVNGDGFADMLIGAKDGNGDTGQAYVVFGSADGFEAEIDLTSLLPESGGDASKGFVLNGVAVGDDFGKAVSAAGDINGDGLGDFLVATTGFGSDGEGRVFVLFGRVGPHPAVVDLSQLFSASSGDGSVGFVVTGIEPEDKFGSSIAAAGDANGDGFDDFIIGAMGASANAIESSGRAFVIFGGRHLGAL